MTKPPNSIAMVQKGQDTKVRAQRPKPVPTSECFMLAARGYPSAI
jgi:hypothetical protein